MNEVPPRVPAPYDIVFSPLGIVTTGNAIVVVAPGP